MIPIVMAVLFNFGLMGALGIPLNMTTAMISSIGMGIGIDYAIHFVYRWRLESDKGYDIRRCISATMGTSGKAIFFNALTISLGFLVLMLSGFPFVRELGLLLSVNMAASYLGATVAIPVALSWSASLGFDLSPGHNKNPLVEKAIRHIRILLDQGA